MERYSKIPEKDSREIVLLRGAGCVYKKCAFCDYHLDFCADQRQNFELNKSVLARVTGEFKNLEVINSGSVFELDEQTIALILKICRDKHIKTLHFESHYLFKDKIPELRKKFSCVDLKMKIGLESFDYDFRERVMLKGIPERDPAKIAEHFNEANFLFGFNGQTAESMKNDIELGLKYFERICVNVMCCNTAHMQPDANVVKEFVNKVYPLYKDDYRVDILINNTDFGVGA